MKNQIAKLQTDHETLKTDHETLKDMVMRLTVSLSKTCDLIKYWIFIFHNNNNNNNNNIDLDYFILSNRFTVV